MQTEKELSNVIIVNISQRIGIVGVLMSQRGTPERKLQVSDLLGKFTISDALAEELGIRALTLEEKIFRRIPAQANILQWPEAVNSTTWEIELSRAEYFLFESIMRSFDGYEQKENWELDIFRQFNERARPKAAGAEA